MAEIEVVEYDEPLADAHTDFARRNWPGKARRADPNYVRWKFRGPEYGPVPGLLLAVSGGEVVGQVGLLPGLVALADDVRPAQWICDAMVDLNHRRKGIVTSILEEGLHRRVVTLGPDPSPSMRRAMDVFGMSQFDASTLMVLTVQAGPTLTLRYPKLRPLEPLVTVAAKPALGLVNRKLLKGRRSHEAQICWWHDVVEAVQRYERNLSMPHAVHDPDFLAWRCGGFGGWARELEAILTNRHSFALFERDEQRLVIHEWAVMAASDAPGLFGRLLFVAEAYGVDYIQAYASTVTEQRLLARLAFRPRRTKIDMWVYPNEELSASKGFAFMGYDSDYHL